MTETYLDKLEKKSVYIIREANAQFKRIGVLCSFGKDSVTMLHLIRKAFPDGQIPFEVIHIDTQVKLPEIYDYRDKLIDKYNLNMRIAMNIPGILKTCPKLNHFECCMERKTNALKNELERGHFDAVMAGIRWDELAERGVERFFSPRKKGKWEILREKIKGEEGDSPFEYLQDAEFSGWDLFSGQGGKNVDHFRVHPLLHWTELDIWNYIKREKIEINPLYYSKNGYRYRSIGCKPCTTPIESDADTVDKIIEELKEFKGVGERDGRTQDKEKIMRRLRTLGYM